MTRTPRRSIVWVALTLAVLGACNRADKKPESATNGCDFATNFTTDRIDSSLTEADIRRIAAKAPEEIRADVATLLGGARNLQGIGQSSTSAEQLDAAFKDEYRDESERVSAFVARHCPTGGTTTTVLVVP